MNDRTFPQTDSRLGRRDVIRLGVAAAAGLALPEVHAAAPASDVIRIGFVSPQSGPLGIFGDYEYVTETCRIAPGQCLFVYTDGVTEAMDAQSAFFSDKRLEAVLKRLSGAPARAVVAEVIASVRDFASGEPQADDIAAMAIRLGN